MRGSDWTAARANGVVTGDTEQGGISARFKATGWSGSLTMELSGSSRSSTWKCTVDDLFVLIDFTDPSTLTSYFNPLVTSPFPLQPCRPTMEMTTLAKFITAVFQDNEEADISEKKRAMLLRRSNIVNPEVSLVHLSSPI
ncbi:hypothetical protein F2P81_015039 [Scophthalmus maximus]|uniref:Uncharacterized protein n=1 Tax=Scophthalmus maximus TaxID=52904 RepID=A0A6A4SJM7_SCOMX|nr:hypothetical protein F2P81_015039 [Scophthalmus maximus]